jgi:hypothetical protein
MPTLHTRRTLIALLTAAVLGAAAGPARAVQLATGSGSGLAGQAVDIALTATSTTGLNIKSFQFDLTYNANLVTATDVLEATTLVSTAGWGDATFNVTTTAGTGKIRVSHAGTTALTGAGVLLRIHFLINPAQLGAASTALTLSNLVFNEGTPNDTTSNGTLTINATPIVTVTPNSGEVIRGQTFGPFIFNGSITPPVTWSTTNPAVATISAAAVLTGVAPGEVKVVAVDSSVPARRDTSDGVVLVRGMGLTVGNASVYVNNTISVPLTVTSLAGLGIRSGQVKLTFPTSVTATGVTRPPGTLLDGYGGVYFGASSGTCTVDFAGPSDLTGTGVLCYVQFAAGPNPGGPVVQVANAVFNETLPAKTTNGTITILALPAITVSPDVVTLLAGATQQFTVSGSPVLPLTWSLTDSTVGTISSSGLFTATQGGTTQVRAVDNVGATDLNTLVDVYDFRATVGTISVVPGGFVNLPVVSDRKVGTLGIRSVQYELGWTGPYVSSVASTSFGLIPAWAPNLLAATPSSTLWRLVAAGTQALANTDSILHRVRFNISASAPVGTNIPITLVSFLCNEGTPRVLKTNGVIQVRTTTDVPGDEVPAAFALAPPRPNPAAGRMLLRFAIPRSDAGTERVRLILIGVDGRLVRSVVDEPFPPGTHEALWDGRDDGGHPVAAGVYFARLEWQGRSETRKVAVVR